MKKIKKIIFSLTLVLMVFMGNLLNVDALTNLDLIDIEDKVIRVVSWMPNFTEEETLDYSILSNFGCWGLFSEGDEYIIGWEDEETMNGPIFKVPADVFEGYILSYFDIKEDDFVELRESFVSPADSVIHDCSYIEENGEFYYQYAIMTGFGIGSADTYNFVKGYVDLEDNYYQVYYYETYNNEYLDDDEKLSDDALLDVDYVEKLDYEGNLVKYKITKISTFKIYYDGINTKFLSYEDIDVSEVPSADELILYNREARSFLEGASQEFNYMKESKLTFRIDMEYNLFDSVYVNGKLVDPKNYTVTSGSTVITFNDNYAESLGAGDHILEVMFKDRSSAITNFKLVDTIDATANPNTESNYGYGLILVVGAIGGALVLIKNRKKIFN